MFTPCVFFHFSSINEASDTKLLPRVVKKKVKESRIHKERTINAVKLHHRFYEKSPKVKMPTQKALFLPELKMKGIL
jgi:hypothetical protein